MALKYAIGDLVWAKLRGKCPWPGRVSDPPTDLELPKENTNYHCIYFFGVKNYKWVRQRNLKPYEKFQEEMMRYCSTEGFMDALNQLVEYMENPEKFTVLGHEVDINEEVDEPKLELKEEIDDPKATTEENVDPKVDTEEVHAPKVEMDEEVDSKIEVDNPMEFSDNQRVSDEKNDCEPMETSVVEQEMNKNVVCPIRVRVLLPRVTIYQCEVCAVCFLNQKKLDRHKQTHVKKIEDKVNSAETRKECDNFNNNSTVIDKNKKEKPAITFTILDNVIKLKYKNGKLDIPPLLNPVLVLDRIEVSKCKLCNQCFANPHECQIHETSHLNSKRFKVKADKNRERHKPYKCSNCDARFVLKSTLDVHSIVHDPFKYICHCGIGYYRFGEYKGHRKLVHNETVWERERSSKDESVHKSEVESDCAVQKSDSKYEIDYNIVTANKRYYNGAAKEDNVIVKSKLGLFPRLKATLPGKRNKRKTKKKSRRKQNNGTYKTQQTFPCTICNKTFGSKCNLQVHQTVHTKEKPYPCNQCKKRFTQQGALKLHLKRHAGIRDFGCQHCPKLFYSSGARDLHERTHTGTKPYRCESCKKEFADPSSYSRHIRTHTGEKRYECNICFKRYTESGPLQRHKITVHDKSKAIKCLMCSKTFCFAFEYRKHLKIEHSEENTD